MTDSTEKKNSTKDEAAKSQEPTKETIKDPVTIEAETEDKSSSDEPTAQPEADNSTTEKSAAEKDDEKFIDSTKKFVASAIDFISGLYTKLKDAIEASGFDPQIQSKAVERILDWVKNRYPAETYKSFSDFLTTLGHWGIVLAEISVILFGITAAIKLGNWVYAAYSVGIAILLAVFQYIANRFLTAGDTLIEATPSSLQSTAFMDCTALLTEITGLLFFLTSMIIARTTGQWSMLWVGLGIWCLCDAFSYISINPKLTNIEIKTDISAGEEAIGILSFIVKTIIRIVPIAFGAGTIIGVIGLLSGTISLMFTGVSRAGVDSIRLIILCTCLPLASYIFFAFYHLTIDILRSILSLSNKK